MVSDENSNTQTRLGEGYERMVERARAALEHAKEDTLPQVRQIIDQLEDKAVELGELTREEAQRLGEYLHQDAAEYLSYTGKSLGDWLNVDLDVAEARLMDMFSLVVDHTRLEFEQLAERARRSQELHTGEIAAPGVLRCTECEHQMHLRSPGHIPPCATCHGTVFQRVSRA